jgi:4-aminobutyrate aminotransferase-like enzyme
LRRAQIDLTKSVAAEAAARGVITLTCGVRGNVIRFLPPLTIGKELLAEALSIIGGVIREQAGAIRKAS